MFFFGFSIVLNAWLFYRLPLAYSEVASQCLPFEWQSFPSNTWVKLKTCGVAPRKVFHGAASLAVDRKEVFFFGADTHEVDYDNSITRLNLENLSWTNERAGLDVDRI